MDNRSLNLPKVRSSAVPTILISPAGAYREAMQGRGRCYPWINHGSFQAWLFDATLPRPLAFGGGSTANGP
jgi:hypothetical protein